MSEQRRRERIRGGAATVVDRQFSDPVLAALYNVICQGRPDFRFYLPIVMAADTVLDVGCGTGELLRRARQAGHRGRLCGLDPAEAMLDMARACTDIEWILGDLSTVAWDQELDLVVMTGHAFQVLVGDEEIRAALAAIRSALTHEGRLAFETRNPRVREWESWATSEPLEFVGPDGNVVQVATEVEPLVSADLVSFTKTYTSPGWERPHASRSTLRFLAAEALAAFLAEAHLTIEEQFGDWDRRRLVDASPEIITLARRS
jgi:SAM-dependent methyltransferase